MAIHERVLEAALRVCREGGGWTFRPQAVVMALGDLNPGSVRTHVMSRCCVNAPPHHAHRWPYFRRLRRGIYQILPAWRGGARSRTRRHGAMQRRDGTRSYGGDRPTVAAVPGHARAPVIVVRGSATGYAAEIPGVSGTVHTTSLDEVVDRARRAALEHGPAQAGHGTPLLLRVDPESGRSDPVVERYMRDIDRTLIRQSLRMTHEQRLAALQDWMNATNEARGVARRKRRRRAL